MKRDGYHTSEHYWNWFVSYFCSRCCRRRCCRRRRRRRRHQRRVFQHMSFQSNKNSHTTNDPGS